MRKSDGKPYFDMVGSSGETARLRVLMVTYTEAVGGGFMFRVGDDESSEYVDLTNRGHQRVFGSDSIILSPGDSTIITFTGNKQQSIKFNMSGNDMYLVVTPDKPDDLILSKTNEGEAGKPSFSVRNGSGNRITNILPARVEIGGVGAINFKTTSNVDSSVNYDVQIQQYGTRGINITNRTNTAVCQRCIRRLWWWRSRRRRWSVLRCWCRSLDSW